jgi:hypothetical protein
MASYLFYRLMKKLDFLPDGLAFLGYAMAIDAMICLIIYEDFIK